MPDRVSENDTTQVMEAVKSLRLAVEKHGTDSAEYKSIAEKTQETIESYEAKNQKIVADLADSVKKQDELKEQITDLEKTVIGLKQAGETKRAIRDTPEYKALQKYARIGSMGEPNREGLAMAPEEKQLLRMDDATAGGYLTTVEMDTEILKQITEISPVRQVARVMTVGKKTLEIPVRTSIPVATYEGEAAAGDDSASTYGAESITAYRQTLTVPYTMDLLMDSEFDLLTQINTDVGEAMAFGEGNRFIFGTGAKQPLGMLADTRLTTTAFTTASSGAISFDDLRRITGELKTAYMPMYAFNRRTKAVFLTLKGSDGQYLWSPAMSDAPASINGEPYILFEDLPDIAANSFSVIYADFMRGYRIIDRTGMTIVRDQYSSKRENIIELTFHRYNSGSVVLPEAIKLMQTAA